MRGFSWLIWKRRTTGWPDSTSDSTSNRDILTYLVASNCRRSAVNRSLHTAAKRVEEPKSCSKLAVCSKLIHWPVQPSILWLPMPQHWRPLSVGPSKKLRRWVGISIGGWDRNSNQVRWPYIQNLYSKSTLRSLTASFHWSGPKHVAVTSRVCVCVCAPNTRRSNAQC